MYGDDDDESPETEQLPLLSPPSSDDDTPTESPPLLERGRSFREEPDDSQESKSIWYLILLTIGVGGLQIAWSVELSNGSPYLLSLGLSKSLMALVWIAGPLTGTIVQPYVGMLSDNCRLAMGKRRPFMLGGAAATVVSLMSLAWTREIVSGFFWIFGADPDGEFVKTMIIVTAVLGIYVLDFAINTVQAALRCFIVDCAPAHQQEDANAMASRAIGIGNIIGYVAGYADLPKVMWFFGDRQFKVLCVIASIALGGTVVLSSATIKERDPRLEGEAPKTHGVLAFFMQVFTSIKKLPPQIKTVCKAQFLAWIGFFPFLFYTSSYIGSIYVQPFLKENPNMTQDELNELYEKATRVGTFALLLNAIVSLLTNLFLPIFISPTYDSPQQATAAAKMEESNPSFFHRLRIPGLTLRKAWVGSLVLFAGAMFCAAIVTSVAAAQAIVCIVGITWALALWAPFAIISGEISRKDTLTRARKQAGTRLQRIPSASAIPPPACSDDDDDDDDDHEDNAAARPEEEEKVDQAGVILGIHNMACAAPQIISTFGSSLLFKIFQKPRGEAGDHSIGIVLALGGLAVLMSSFFVMQLRDSAKVPAEAQRDLERGGILSRASSYRRKVIV